jgi:tetratricopeptide (TPR) repeat protein
MQLVSETHINLFTKKKVSLLCGAGISINSGIPSVIPLIRYILQKLKAEEKDIDTFINSGFPFEATMEVLKDRFVIIDLLKIFDIEFPNNNHELIAWLMKKGYLAIVLTTNFDRNIEIALENLGMKANKDFFLVSDITNFNIEEYSEKPLLVKLHGSIEHMPDILSTITRVANKSNNERMLQVFSKVFSSNKFNSLITWGYSFSDHFDIKPAFIQMLPCEKSIYSLQHQKQDVAECVDNISNDVRYSKFKVAFKLCGDLDEIVANIETHFKLSTDLIINKVDWESNVNKWLDNSTLEKGFSNNNCIIGILFIAAGYCKIARFYAERSLQDMTNTIEGRKLQLDAYSIIGKSYLRDPNERDIEKAQKFIEGALSLSYDLQLQSHIEIHSANLASCYMMSKQYQKAEPIYQKVIAHFTPMLLDEYKKFGAADKVTGYQTMLAHCLAKQNRVQEALELYSNTLVMCNEFGLMANKELCTTGYGIAHIHINEPKQALNLFIEAYPLAKEIGLADRIRSVFYLICSWKKEVEGEKYAREFYELELKFVKEKTEMNVPFNEIPPRLI